jgi:hypothetical protein
MAIDAALPVSQEIALASAVPQASLTRRDRELQVAEGLPPIEVSEAGMEALRWRKNEDLREKWKKRRELRRARGQASGAEAREEDEEGGVEALLREEPDAESLEGEPQDEDATGTLFDDRS